MAEPEIPFTWSEPDLEFLDALWATQVARMDHLPDFWMWTEAMINDLDSARIGASTEAEAESIDSARFITCMPALHATRVAGQLGDCYDWIRTALAPGYIRGKRINKILSSFPHFSPALFTRYVRRIPEFTTASFYIAYKLGGLDDLTASIARSCWNISSLFHHHDETDDEALDAMVQMVIWAGHRNWPEAPLWASELLACADRTQSLRQRLKVAMVFATPANRYVAGTSREWAERALRDYRSVMHEHEWLQARAVTLAGPADWDACKAEVLAEIARLRSLYLSALRPGESELEVLELRVWILHPLVFALVTWGEIDDLVALLGAWYRSAGAVPADRDLLAVVSNHKGGAAYLWRGGRLLTGTGDTTTLDAMHRAAGEALGEYFRGSDGDHAPELYENRRFDVVDAQAAHAWDRAISKHYRFEALGECLPGGWSPQALLVFPGGPEPIQAMLSKTIGITAPLEVSFERARPFRPIQRISVWAGGLFHEEFELDALWHVADRAGWVLDVHQSTEATLDDLRQFYEDDKADILWVISHGTHDPFAFRGTGLHLPDETLVGSEELRHWRTPDQRRRLLVLNTCSAASAQNRGGLARIGLAQSLVSDRQAVVGHLWPVHWAVGLAFGAALAACLETNPMDAAALVAAGLMQEPKRLLTFLDDCFRWCDGLLNRLHLSHADYSSLANWGSPALFT